MHLCKEQVTCSAGVVRGGMEVFILQIFGKLLFLRKTRNVFQRISIPPPPPPPFS